MGVYKLPGTELTSQMFVSQFKGLSKAELDIWAAIRDRVANISS